MSDRSQVGTGDEAGSEGASREAYSRPGLCVAGLLAALPFLAMGGAYALGPGAAIAGLLGAPWRRLPGALAGGGLPLWLAGAFAAWLWASTSWTPHTPFEQGEPLASRYELAVFSGVLVGCVLLAFAAGGGSRGDRNLGQRAGAAGVTLLLGFGVLEAQLDFPIGRALAGGGISGRDLDTAAFSDDAQRAVAIALICFWAVIPVMARFRAVGVVGLAGLASVCVSLSLRFSSASNAIALGAAIIPALFALKWPRATLSILGQSIAAWTVLTPLVAPALADRAAQAFKQSVGVDAPFAWQARAESWSYIADRVRQRPFWGWGFGSSVHFHETYSVLGFTLPYIPRHLHNAPLQLWLETGAIGAVLAAGALASFGRRVGAALANDRWAACAAAGAIATAGVLFNVSAGAWSLWWWGAVAASAGFIRLARAWN